jgi:putative aldouronate transport system substrate-binding protein
MWAAGLIDPAAFSQDYAAMIATGNHAGDIILGGGTVNDPGGMVTIGQEDKRDAVYNPVPPLTGPGGQNATYILPSVPGATFVLTSKASEAKQKKIMEILNYLFSFDGHVRAEFGEEGVGWEKAGPGDIALDQSLTPTFKDLPFDEKNPADYNGDWRRQAQYNETYDFRNAQVQPLDTSGTAGYERRLFDATQLYLDKPKDAIFPYWNVWVDPKDNSELATLQVNIESFVSTATAEFVTGTRDPSSDAAWEQYLTDLDNLGAARYLEIWQNAYDANK